MSRSEPSNRFQQLTDVFGRHMVGLAFTDEPEANARTGRKEGREYWLLTGFVVSVQQRIFLVVAAHVVRDLKLRREEMKRRFASFFLVDRWHSAEGKIEHLPFAFDFNLVIQVLDDALGFDCAFIPLRPMYSAPLIAGGVVPLDEKFWEDPPETDDFRLVGMPSQTRSVSATPVEASQVRYRVDARMPILTARRLRELPPGVGFGAASIVAELLLPPSFAEESGNALEFDDIDGMSGGPLFGLQIDGDQFRYWLCGVQSGWYKERKIIGASPMPILCKALQDAIRAGSSNADGEE